MVLLNVYSRRPVFSSKMSPRKMTASAFVNSAFVPEYRAGWPPGFPVLTQIAVELSSGSKGHLAMPVEKKLHLVLRCS